MRRKRRFILCVALATLILVLIPACNKTSNVSFSVGGNIVGEVDFAQVVIAVNGEETAYRADADGKFSIPDLRENDIVTFVLAGYDFSSITVGKSSLDNLMIAAKRKLFTVSVSFNAEGGAVIGAGKYEHGSEVELTFAASEHYVLSRLSEDGKPLVAENGEYRFIADKDRNLVAEFSKLIYPITFNKNFDEGVATATQAAVFGGTVVLDASDSDDYLFSKWIVNDIDFTSKHYEFALNDVNTTVTAVFIPRLTRPVLTLRDNVVSWQSVKDADGYEVYIDDVKTDKAQGLSLNLRDVNPYTGRHIVRVLAVASDYAKSPVGEITVDYIRPVDTPKNSGIVRKEGKPYFTFSKVLGAVGYKVAVNGSYTPLSQLRYEEKENEIAVDLSPLLTAAGEYTFSVIALGGTSEANSAPSAEATYLYSPELAPPIAEITSGVLSWSHADEGVTFDIIVAGVTVLRGTAAGSLNLDEIIERDGAEIIVVAKKTGYTDGIRNIQYIK